MDKSDIPISMSIHPVNTSKQGTAIPLVNDVVSTLNESNFIYCTNAGPGSYNIRKFNSMGGHTFIVT